MAAVIGSRTNAARSSVGCGEAQGGGVAAEQDWATANTLRELTHRGLRAPRDLCVAQSAQEQLVGRHGLIFEQQRRHLRNWRPDERSTCCASAQE